MTAASTETPAPGSLVDVARELTDALSAQADACEAAGVLTDATVALLRDSGLVGLWVPERFGGAEAAPLEALEVIEAVSYADGATGWVLMAWQVAMASAAAYLPAPTANAVFGGEGIPIIAGTGAPMGRALAEGDGFRLSGRWRYGSGLRHAAWTHSGAPVYEGDRPRMLPGTNLPEVRIFIVSIEQTELHSGWEEVLGLRATASVDYSISDVFVPAEYTHQQSANVPVSGGNLYRLGIGGMGAICHSAWALGVGRRALDELAAIAVSDPGLSTRIPQPGGGEAFHERYSLAEARFRAARAFVVESQSAIAATIMRGEQMSTRQISLARLALNHVTSTVAEIGTFAYLYGGGSSLRPGALQRCFRDIYTGTQHATTGPAMLQPIADDLLGLADGKVWFGRGLVDPT
jgi:alkylation response protein AidB-like acyl-CoA dehydrogenase